MSGMQNLSEDKRSNGISNLKLSVKSKSKLQRIQLGKITALGWIRQQLEIEANGSNGHMDELEPEMLTKAFISKKLDYDIGVSDISWAYNHLSGYYWWGLIQLAFILDDERLKEKAEKWVNGVLAFQDKDGYIGYYNFIHNRMWDWDAFSTKLVTQALLSYYEATGRKDVLEACCKALLWFAENKEVEIKKITANQGPTLIESMIDVYILTGDKRLLDWAENCMHELNKAGNIHSYPLSVDCLNSDKLYYNSIHAVTYADNVKIPAILYCGDGNEEYLNASINGIDKLLKRCMQRTGAPSTNYEFLSPPGAVCESEVCDFAFYSDSFRWLGAITGNPKYGDLIEKIIFNASEGAKKKDGKAIAYMTSPNQRIATQFSSTYGAARDQEVYAPVYTVPCCPTIGVGILPKYVRGMCMTDEKGELYFVCYGPSRMSLETVDGVNVQIEEITDYPFKEDITFKLGIDKPLNLRLNFRIPEWCNNASIKINGKEVDGYKAPGEYFAIEIEWHNGDAITVTFPMEVKIVEVDDSNSSNKRPIAVERGPLLFSLRINEQWEEYEGNSYTKLPEGWAWYEAYPEENKMITAAYALFQKDEDIKVIYEDTKGAYPWEKSPVKILIPVLEIENAYLYFNKTTEVYESTFDINEFGTDKLKTVELVPYGCTTLRISYFPKVVKKSKKLS